MYIYIYIYIYIHTYTYSIPVIRNMCLAKLAVVFADTVLGISLCLQHYTNIIPALHNKIPA